MWIFVNGDRVEGTWKDGKMHGFVTTSSFDGKISIKEYWKNGRYVGKALA